jgi:hypothetical protein
LALRPPCTLFSTPLKRLFASTTDPHVNQLFSIRWILRQFLQHSQLCFVEVHTISALRFNISCVAGASGSLHIYFPTLMRPLNIITGAAVDAVRLNRFNHRCSVFRNSVLYGHSYRRNDLADVWYVSARDAYLPCSGESLICIDLRPWNCASGHGCCRLRIVTYSPRASRRPVWSKSAVVPFFQSIWTWKYLAVGKWF